MMIYEVINPSDMVTFLSDDDKIAYACTVLVGNGRYGCKNLETHESLPCLLLFVSAEEFEQLAADYLGEAFGSFIHNNREVIKGVLSSFSYCSAKDRRTYDDAISAITDPAQLAAFKAKHDDKNRTSMNQIVNRAWDISKGITI